MICGKIIRRALIPALFVIAWLAAPGAAFAVKHVFSTLIGGAIRGYDPVSYFTEAKPVKGKSTYQFKWRGATWSFASSENRDRFVKNPDKYAPQYGGYCAWAVSRGLHGQHRSRRLADRQWETLPQLQQRSPATMGAGHPGPRRQGRRELAEDPEGEVDAPRSRIPILFISIGDGPPDAFGHRR